MYERKLHESINHLVQQSNLEINGTDNLFYTRLLANTASLHALFSELYGNRANFDFHWEAIIQTIINAYTTRPEKLKQKDREKSSHWFLSNKITGMSLYVDRFCGDLKSLPAKLPYCKNLGLTLLHLMPLFESPTGESDGGYAVSNFRKLDEQYGNIKDLLLVQDKMEESGMYLMLDIVLNHTSHLHEWAGKAKAGDPFYQAFYYMFENRDFPDQFEQYMPDIFPESSPGSFVYNNEMQKWVMTVFHNYQWDLNFTNPHVLLSMLENIFFYANIGVDILRIDAPAFIWKQLGTSCQNLPQAHLLLRLIKLCVQVATPGMALLGEAIVAPKEIMKYFGSGTFTAKECDLAYAATNMALQWDTLATGDTRVMLAAQHEILQKPFGCTWITYTRCHDDIGLGYDNEMIAAAGFNAYEHRKFIKEYYSGVYPGSPATGALFSVNPKTQDARISGSLASLCGLEIAIKGKNKPSIQTALNKIILMQAQTLFIGGIPMLFYGDEAGYTNDYSYRNDKAKSYDNRWMHRPLINWKKNALTKNENTVEGLIYNNIRKLIALRNSLPMVADLKNITWLTPHNIHVAGFVRHHENRKLFCLFNYSDKTAYVTWYIFKEQGISGKLLDHYTKKEMQTGTDSDYLIIEPYGFYLLEKMPVPYTLV
jgi:amylosucrase